MKFPYKDKKELKRFLKRLTKIALIITLFCYLILILLFRSAVPKIKAVSEVEMSAKITLIIEQNFTSRINDVEFFYSLKFYKYKVKFTKTNLMLSKFVTFCACGALLIIGGLFFGFPSL